MEKVLLAFIKLPKPKKQQALQLMVALTPNGLDPVKRKYTRRKKAKAA